MIQITKQKNLNILVPQNLMNEVKIYAIHKDIKNKEAVIELLELGLRHAKPSMPLPNFLTYAHPNNRAEETYPLNQKNNNKHKGK